MGLGGALLQGLAAAMAMGTAEPLEDTPAAPLAEETRPDCAKPAKTGCKGDPNAVEGVTVEGEKRGKTEGPIEPELVLDEEAIKAYGASSIAELMAAIAPLTRSNRGRGDEPPIQLINGQRISGPQELRGVPPEAIFKTEILPEEASLAYGYRADQKVVNFKLKKDFRAITLQNEGRGSTDGGRATTEQQANLFRVNDKGRWTVDLRYNRGSPLYEQERDIVRAATGAPYDLQGNIGAVVSGGEIDPALSALVGSSVTTAAVPVSAASGAPALGDFVSGAGRVASDDLTASRTLIGRSEEGSIQSAYSRNFGKVTTALSGNLERSNRVSFQGLPGVSVTLPAGGPFSPFAQDVTLYRYVDAPDAMRRKVDTDKIELGVNALGMWSGWRWNVAGNFDRTDSATRTGRGLDATALRAAVAAGDPAVNPFGPLPTGLLRQAASDSANSVSTNAKAEVTMAGTLLEMPTGRLRATFKGGLDSRKIESESVRSGVLTARVLTRDRATLQSSLDAPIANRGGGGLGVLGDVSINGNLLYEQFSDIGGLVTVGGGVSWSPIKGLSFSANYSSEEGEPTPQQVNDPVLQTQNTSMYDFATGQTVLVTRIDGGNPNLTPDSRQVVKLGLNYKPFDKRDLSLFANYTASRIDDQIATLPSVSPELEAAFPERFTRDAAGRLTLVDRRPVNFAHADQEQLRWGLNYTLRWGGPPPPTPGSRPAPGSPPRPGGAATSGAGFLQVSLTHTWRLRDEVVIRDGMAPLDLLNGASLGRWGGTPRHEVSLQANVYKDGLGGFVRGAWKSSTWIDGGATGDDVYFSDLPTFSLYSYADLGSRKTWVKRYPGLKGARVTLGVDNLFNTKQSVRDQQGRTPQAYQRDYMDPLGRTVSLRLRKQF